MIERKQISKKLRFEIFKRDGFCCMYCGRTPPIVLEVDHIVPVAEGGDNSEDNLVTSCFDCNRGKGAVSLRTIPESLADRAERVKEAEAQLAEYRRIMQEKEDRIDCEVWEIVRELYGENTNEIRKDFYASIVRFLAQLDFLEVRQAAEIASSKPYFSDSKMFRYFCGICWNRIKGAE